MVAIQHLKNAPVVEGLVDFRVRPSDGLVLNAFEGLWESVKDRFPVRKEMKRIHACFALKEGEPVNQSVAPEVVGYRFERSDGRSIIQVQLDGFTLSHLSPYDAWESLIADAKVFWEEYRRFAKPSGVVRVATRFINRLEFPTKGEIDLDDFLRAGPRIPEGLSQNIGEFLTRILVNDPKTDASIVVIQALEAFNPKNNTLPILLDIDVFKIVEFDPAGHDHWKLLEEFRHLKNMAFFSSITDKTLGLLK
jgi:uncharacterized protein (TIGR04255 family)